ncbi:50S ribosomal protein L22 [Candidatus Parcubacteria bacterium]|nr:50S ribosomal protein L22 [Candidatus Parcubacteria bacterium]
MAEAKAELNNYRQSPRKVRTVAGTVKGKSVEEALVILSFVGKRAALPLQKLVASAVANAKNLSIPEGNLVVKSLTVDKGPTLYRRRPRSRGMANPIRKRTSMVRVVLAEKK